MSFVPTQCFAWPWFFSDRFGQSFVELVWR
jgi:hypothetical protein